MRIPLVVPIVLSCAAAAGPGAIAQEVCALEVELVDRTGTPAPAGILVEAEPAAGPGATGVHPGGERAVIFEGLPCGAGTVSAGQVQGLVGMTMFRPWARAEYFVAGGGRVTIRLEVPALHPVTVRVEDLDGRPVASGVVSTSHVPGAAGPFVAGGTFPFTADGRARFFLETGRFRIDYRPRPGRNVAEVVVNGSLAETEPIVDIQGPLEIVFRVSSAVRITGRVTDSEGRAVSGVFLETLDGNGAILCRLCWVPGDDGSFVIETARLPVAVRATAHGTEWTFEPRQIDVRSPDEAEGLLFLARPDETGRLAGVVLATRDGDPVPGATVVSEPGCPAGVEIRREWYAGALTDDRGRFEVPCPEDCAVDLTIVPPSGSEFTVTRWAGSADDCSREQRIVMKKGNTITGTVRDARNRPVPALPITVRDGTAECVTDDEGRYTLAGLGSGDLEIAIDPRAVRGERRSWVLLPADVPYDLARVAPPTVRFESGGGENVKLDLRVVEGGTACVIVTSPDGEPVPLGRLRAYAPDHDVPRRQRRASGTAGRDEPGRLCVGPLPPGDYQILAGESTGHFVPSWWPGEEDRDLAGTVETEEGGVVEIGPIRVRPAGRALLRPEGASFEEGTPIAVRIRAAALEEDRPDAPADDPESDEPEPPSWEPVPEAWVTLVNRTPVRDLDEKRNYDEIGVAPLPVGRWEIRLCAGPKGCDGDLVWCTEEPVEVGQGRRTEARLRPAGDEGCPASNPETEPGRPVPAC